jgi:predicted metal-dependent phosphotriesterase family hydrolase
MTRGIHHPFHPAGNIRSDAIDVNLHTSEEMAMAGGKRTRREFLRAAALGIAFLEAGGFAAQRATSKNQVMTVRGPVPADGLGIILPHEHVIADFIGAEKVSRDRYDANDVISTVLPHLNRFRELGGRTIVECTPAYLGRDVEMLRRLSGVSGVHIVTNTGYYGGMGNKFLPAHAFTETAEQLAERWVREWRRGIEGTGIRPGFIKLGVGAGQLTPLHEKLIRAGIMAHRSSGLTVAVHTGDGTSALEQLRLLRREGVDPAAWIWVHAQHDPGPGQLEFARAGGWVSLDGMRESQLDSYSRAVLNLKQNGLIHRVLLSADDGWSIEGKPRGENLKTIGNEAPYAILLTRFISLLREGGFTEDEVALLIRTNPARAFALRSR